MGCCEGVTVGRRCGGERGEGVGELLPLAGVVSQFTKISLRPKSFQSLANSELPSLGSKWDTYQHDHFPYNFRPKVVDFANLSTSYQLRLPLFWLSEVLLYHYIHQTRYVIRRDR